MKDAPAPTKLEVCEKCGDEFERPKGRKRHYCHPCMKLRYVETSEQQSLKAGPAYEKAVRSQVIYWRDEAKRLGIRV